MKIYYAHHIWKYNTEIEKYEISLLKKKFLESNIINPNGYVIQNRNEFEIMDDCYTLIKECDAVAFSSLSGTVGRGVVNEINLSIELGKEIYYIHDNEVENVNHVEFIPIGDSKTNRIYANVIAIH